MRLTRDRREAILRLIERQPLLAGRFSNIQRIGSCGGDGTFSLVCCALDEQTNKRVALKFFNPQYAKDPYRWYCFQREADVLKNFVGSRDILQWVAPVESFSYVHETADFDFEEDFSFYAAELASSDAQSAVLLGKWHWAEKLNRFRAMCRSIQRIHASGVVHRDIKLSNFLTADERTLLCDFGTARSLTDGTEPILSKYAFPVGDMTYASLELFAGLQDVDPSIYFKSDLYALGATFFELMTRTPLNPQLFDDSLMADLTRTMNAVPRSSRVRIYNHVLPSLEAGHPLPPLQDFASNLPTCIVEPIDKLYRGLCRLDYRHRLSDFRHTFSYLNQACIILNNEAAYKRWRDRRDTFRQNTVAKRLTNLTKHGVMV
jgi:serine/threonine protein kinase